MTGRVAKGLLVVTGLLVGLGLAVLGEGRMRHLRALAGESLPVWSRALSPDAGFGAGRLADVTGLLPFGGPVDLRWKFDGIDLSGATYKVALTDAAGAVDLQARLRVPFGAGWQALEFSQGEGVIDLGATYAAPRGLPLTGRLLVVDGSGVLDGTAKQFRSLALTGSLAEGRFDGFDLGQVRLVLRNDAGGEWLGDVTADGGVLDLSAGGRGRLNQNVFALEGKIGENPDMPEGWRRYLNQSLRKTDAGWSLPPGMDLDAPDF
ncbi:hypothetical protein [Neptunicoccus sediminis]|uniref:hypothetical protein n=1 Tax=Neptunicoccus sediminis TaxID=1892596 RepID=UPI000845CFAD|nr:hypothetical protein [Neptunicoccus sediminis]